MKFDLTDLKVFVSAVDGGSLTSAAAENNVVVAAVSARLRRLENTFGLELFERTGRGIRPTLAGEMLARRARQLVDDARKAETELEEFAVGRSGQVRLLSNTNMLAEHMPQALSTFLADNPQIDVTVQDRPSLEVVTMLKNGDADIGIVASSADMSKLERWRFVPDRLVVVIPPDWDVTGQMSFSEILSHPQIGLRETVALSQFLWRTTNELGRKPHIRIRVDGFEGLCRMVEGGAGIGIVPETAARRYARFMRFQTRPIAEDWAERELFLCVRAEAQLPRYGRALLTHLLDYVEKIKGKQGS
ncbi:LysR family transcriptional regulator [Neorhizobium sp. NCHU2750]|uniref:LysR family transcriptional regulator n=1 Tax=Neorhizobium sp. NCHU2750 TaxID=1825976 RepID=UPI000E715DCD|nr:LysR family transcriptional regulator [Neorhizobium sp. NCHU2750]